jgi:hypothetical protein
VMMTTVRTLIIVVMIEHYDSDDGDHDSDNNIY